MSGAVCALGGHHADPLLQSWGSPQCSRRRGGALPEGWAPWYGAVLEWGSEWNGARRAAACGKPTQDQLGKDSDDICGRDPMWNRSRVTVEKWQRGILTTLFILLCCLGEEVGEGGCGEGVFVCFSFHCSHLLSTGNK